MNFFSWSPYLSVYTEKMRQINIRRLTKSKGDRNFEEFGKLWDDGPRRGSWRSFHSRTFRLYLFNVREKILMIFSKMFLTILILI